VSGQCACSAGAIACGNDGCVDPTSNPSHCGGCFNDCAPGEQCVSGQCICPAGMTTCDGACVDTATDPQFCGDCFNSCDAGSTCSGGQCSCLAGQTCGDRCVSVQTSPNDCGDCFNGCGASEMCVGGQCQCRQGLTSCNGTCVDLLADVDNCGQCDNVCDDKCVDGACQITGCNDIGRRNCGDACIPEALFQTDPLNCGDCDNVCDADQVCTGGDCRTYFPPPGCSACPCPQCGAGTTCCTLPGGGYPVCVDGSQCP
jgi:hypothetical protein